MTTIEERVRAAATAAGNTVTPGSAPPLRLPRESGRRSRPGRRGGRRNWTRVIVPLAAAASVTAVVAGVLTAVGTTTAGRAHQAGQHQPGPALAPSPPPRVDGLPAYFLARPIPTPGRRPGGLGQGSPSHSSLYIMVTATGRLAATATLPGAVIETAATGDGTFYAAVLSGPATRFYELRPPAEGTVATVTRLPIPGVPSVLAQTRRLGQIETSPVASLAASPDGSRLAISTYVPHGVMDDIQKLIVASTATGRERVWTTPGPDSAGSTTGTITWLADGHTLAFNWVAAASATPSSSLRLLDIAAPGSDLLAGRAVVSLNRNDYSDFTISPDGQVLIGIADHPKGPATVAGRQVAFGSVIEFSARTGAARVLYQQPNAGGQAASANETGNCNDPLWMSNSGHAVLLVCTGPLPQGPPDAVTARVMLLENGRATQLSWLAGIDQEEPAFGG